MPDMGVGLIHVTGREGSKFVIPYGTATKTNKKNTVTLVASRSRLAKGPR